MLASSSSTITLGLLDLPEDVLKVVLSRRFLSPRTLMECACVCKAAAAVALPELYSDLLVPSFAALPLIYSTLQSRRDLAQQVRSVTASRSFVLSFEFSECESTIQECRMCPHSPIVSMSKAIQRLGLETLNNKLPMPWFVRIAKICPNLTAVDMTEIATFAIDITCLFLGLADLARILRSRLGRFQYRANPFSCVLVKDRVLESGGVLFRKPPFALDVYFVDSIDWSRKQIAVTDVMCTNTALGSSTCLTPFRDLVPLDDQLNWTIGDVTLRNNEAKARCIEQGNWVVSSWLESKRELWLKGGLVKGQDRVFDFSQRPGLIRGSAVIAASMPVLDLVTSSIEVDMRRQCRELVVDAPDPTTFLRFPPGQRQKVFNKGLALYEPLARRPMTFISLLHLSAAPFLVESTVAHFMSLFATGLPNLTHLELFKVACPIDYALHHADTLIRRPPTYPGKLLQSLTIGSFIAHPAHAHVQWPYGNTSSPKDWPLAEPWLPASNHRACRLEKLELMVRGGGVDHLVPEKAATVAIHPVTLRNLRNIRLESVKLYLPPPQLAQTDSPSFIPLSHIPSHARRLCPVNYTLVLPNLEELTLSSNAFNLSATRTSSGRNATSLVLHAIPRAPSLTHFFMFVDYVEGKSKVYTTGMVLPTVRRFPRLEHARFNYLTETQSLDQIAQEVLDEMFAPYPRELAPCPRLRCVQVNDGEPIEYYRWLLAREKPVDSGLELVQMSSLAVED
ncbi:hypothetical protein BCR44DRAFT_1439721 [Catenaria anguillulae PL171]|uniref:F-box domain-containing protein n=1 Tax=Catenaria anguillulae PL171 TaxID=765915 RepID=A0A1Y2HDN0_9FUNG|nr:hypothetical protein BCR44DRAFT_1439721 [Catenaria anguillulae PL171]